MESVRTWHSDEASDCRVHPLQTDGTGGQLIDCVGTALNTFPQEQVGK